jgi:hypothetical protein
VAVSLRQKRLAEAPVIKQDIVMDRRPNPRRPRTPSDHQKRIRFLTGLSFFIIIVVTILVFWFANRGIAPH